MTVRNRLRRLEGRAGPSGPMVDCIMMHTVAPSPDGPKDLGPQAALLPGKTVFREDGESEADFLSRVEAAKADKGKSDG